MNNQQAQDQKIFAKHDLASRRTDIESIKRDNLPLALPPIVTKPEDIKLMFASKMALEMLRQKVRVDNMVSAYKKAYEQDHPSVSEFMDKYQDEFNF